MNDVISLGLHRIWRRKAIREMRIKSGFSVLDVCCGTGDWTLRLARATGLGGKVIGLDFSSEMLKIAEERSRRLNLHKQVAFVSGDAMQLPFAANTFDRTTMGFGLRNVPDMLGALQEMRRVTKPTGQVVLLELSKPNVPTLAKLQMLYLKYIVPKLAQITVCKASEYSWLGLSLRAFPNYQQLTHLLIEHLKLSKVRCIPLLGGVAAIHIGVKPDA
jgi:demethylmenaquinone methyltransferase/2-methoxy-6-polyprenyl-1,4-benzoquinol methylase